MNIFVIFLLVVIGANLALFAYCLVFIYRNEKRKKREKHDESTKGDSGDTGRFRL